MQELGRSKPTLDEEIIVFSYLKFIKPIVLLIFLVKKNNVSGDFYNHNPPYMKKLLLVLIVSVTAICNSGAQQYAQFSQYMVNPYLINPALSGAEDYVDVKMGYRAQWAGFEDAPRTMYLGGHSPIGKPHGVMTHKGDDHNWHGVGGLVYRDVTGPTSRTSAYANYSYNLQITPGSGYGINHKDGIRASLGIFMGFQQYAVDGSKLTTEIDNDDALLSNATQTKFVPDASVGAMIYFRDIFYIELSAFQILANKLNVNGLGNEFITEESRLARHFFFSAGTKQEVSRDIYLIPSILVKTVGPAPISVDLNTRIDIQDKYYAGISYRHGDAVALMAGLVIDRRYEVAYSYDITLSDISRFSNGSHEMILGIRLPPPFVQRNADDWF